MKHALAALALILGLAACGDDDGPCWERDEASCFTEDESGRVIDERCLERACCEEFVDALACTGSACTPQMLEVPACHGASDVLACVRACESLPGGTPVAGNCEADDCCRAAWDYESCAASRDCPDIDAIVERALDLCPHPDQDPLAFDVGACAQSCYYRSR